MSADGGQLTRTLVAARTRLVRICTELSNQIRGLMKTFGLVVPAGKGSTFEKNVRSLLVDQRDLSVIVLPMLEAWRGLRIRAMELGRQLVAGAHQNQACRILMSIPGVGAITATPLRRPLRIRRTLRTPALSPPDWA